jgi:Rrf2 family protein
LACIGSWKGDWVQTEQIHDCTEVPKPYLRKLLHALGKARLINTKRGYQGGFVLARQPKEITLLDVIEAVEPDEPRMKCLLGLTSCSNANPCAMHCFWHREWVRIETELARTTLADAANFLGGPGGILAKCAPSDYTPTQRSTQEDQGQGVC